MRIDNPIGINAALTGSFSGSFIGDGSGITNVAASNVEYANVLNKPTLLSGSAQIASAISGSFTAVSASIATRFDNLGSGFATDSELSAVSSSLASNISNIYSTYATDTELANVSSSLASNIANIYSTYATDSELSAVSSSLSSDIANIYNTYATDSELAVVSASLASNIVSINNTISGLDNTYATDSQLAALSASLIAVDADIHSDISILSSSLSTNVQSVNTRVTTLSGSFATRIDNINTAINALDNTYATDADLISVSSSFASTTSTNVQIARINSGSFATRIDNINTTISNLGSTYATDSELASVSSSFATRQTTDEVILSSAVSVNNIQNNRLAALEAATGSYQAGLTFNDTSGQAGINFTNTSGTITAVATGLSTSDDVTFNNGTFNNGIFNGSVTIDGNLIVSGSSTSLQVQNLQVADAFIYLNSGSNSTNPDMGFAGNYNDGTYHHAGFFRDASDAGTFKVFENYGPEPDASIYIDTTHATFRLAPFAAAKITATSITGSLSGNASTASKLATARTITLGGDLTGNVSFDGSGDVTLTAAVAANSVALGTDTTGDYVASLVAGTGISVGAAAEGATPTITNTAPDQTVVLTAGSNVSISGTYPSFTIASTDTNTTYTAGTGLSLTSTTFSIDSSVVTLSGAQTLTNKTIGGGQLVDASVTNAKLANSSVTVTAGTGMSGGGAVSLGGSVTLTNAGVTSNVAGSGISIDQGTGAVTITNSDKGSSQYIFKNIAVAGQTTVVADTNDDTLTLAAGSNITITTNASTDTITIAATDTNTTYSAGTGLSLSTTTFAIDSTVATLTGTQTLTNKTISGASNTLSNIANASLTNSSVTVTAGTGMSGGGAVSLGGSVTLTNAGVTSVTAGTGISVSASTGGVTITNTISNTNQLTNGAGYITASSTDTLTNKSGNISQWTNNSGYITSSGTAAAISKTISAGSTHNFVYATMADNDFARIIAGGSSNSGYIAIDTADDGTEPIYVRQYTGEFSSLTRTATLLDGSGNTTFPGDVTAYSSDERLKENVKNIPNALDKVLSLNGVTFDWKQEALDAGFNPSIKEGDAGVLAQQVQAVLPQAVRYAPFDRNHEGESISGQDYLTVQYEKLAPLFIEAIKEQQKQIELLKAELAELKNK